MPTYVCPFSSPEGTFRQSMGFSCCWPAQGKVEFIRFIRSDANHDHKLRILGRAITMPDGSAYQYVTATLDLALATDEHNLLISNDQGELLSTGRLPTPAR